MKTVNARRIRTHLVMVAGAIASFCIAGTGSLAWAAEPMRVVVSYEDLNTHSVAGVKSLYRRLRSAAQTVCAPLDDGRNSPSNFRFQGCYKAALDSAVAKINTPALTAMHASARLAAGG